ncbi:PfkB family carbohydrate kinase [Nonomuraea sp. NPDC001699]
MLLLQLEIPAEVACHTAETGARTGLTVVLDPAPARPLPDRVWPHVAIVTPDESEARALTGVEVIDVESAERAAAWFLERGVRHALITLGSTGAVSVTPERTRHFPAYAKCHASARGFCHRRSVNPPRECQQHTGAPSARRTPWPPGGGSRPFGTGRCGRVGAQGDQVPDRARTRRLRIVIFG